MDNNFEIVKSKEKNKKTIKEKLLINKQVLVIKNEQSKKNIKKIISFHENEKNSHENKIPVLFKFLFLLFILFFLFFIFLQTIYWKIISSFIQTYSILLDEFLNTHFQIPLNINLSLLNLQVNY